MTDALPEQLVRYFADRQAQRADTVDDFLTKLTDRERVLITQAAVMGYVQGVRHPDGERIPKNTPILRQVIDACFAFPDLYPGINAIARYTVDVQDSVDYFIQCQQPDGTWGQATGPRNSLAEANEELDRQREHRPDLAFRVVQRQSSVMVYTLPEADDEEG